LHVIDRHSTHTDRHSSGAYTVSAGYAKYMALGLKCSKQ